MAHVGAQRVAHVAGEHLAVDLPQSVGGPGHVWHLRALALPGVGVHGDERVGAGEHEPGVLALGRVGAQAHDHHVAQADVLLVAGEAALVALRANALVKDEVAVHVVHAEHHVERLVVAHLGATLDGLAHGGGHGGEGARIGGHGADVHLREALHEGLVGGAIQDLEALDARAHAVLVHGLVVALLLELAHLGHGVAVQVDLPAGLGEEQRNRATPDLAGTQDDDFLLHVSSLRLWMQSVYVNRFI